MKRMFLEVNDDFVYDLRAEEYCVLEKFVDNFKCFGGKYYGGLGDVDRVTGVQHFFSIVYNDDCEDVLSYTLTQAEVYEKLYELKNKQDVANVRYMGIGEVKYL